MVVTQQLALMSPMPQAAKKNGRKLAKDVLRTRYAVREKLKK